MLVPWKSCILSPHSRPPTTAVVAITTLATMTTAAMKRLCRKAWTKSSEVRTSTNHSRVKPPQESR